MAQGGDNSRVLPFGGHPGVVVDVPDEGQGVFEVLFVGVLIHQIVLCRNFYSVSIIFQASSSFLIRLFANTQ